MPAIDLARLKTKTVRLSDKFGEPEALLRDLLELLDLYTNRTLRPSQVALRTSLPTYRSPRPVLRQIEIELAPLAESRPTEAVTLTIALWEASYFETRLLAAALTGFISPAAAMTLYSRIPDWLVLSKDKEIQQALLTKPFVRVRRENPQAMLFLLEDWLQSPRPGIQSWGLQALIPLLNEPRFENLPAVFRILRPALEAAGPATQNDLAACLAALERVSPTEMLFFLREALTGTPRPMMVRTLRRILPSLSPETQAGLRETLRITEGG